MGIFVQKSTILLDSTINGDYNKVHDKEIEHTAHTVHCCQQY